MTRAGDARRRTFWALAALAATALGALALSACSADEVDYTSAAEEVARETVESLVPGEATASCGDPDSTKVGTMFDCTGTGADGSSYTFSAEITKEKEVTVTLLGPSASSAGSEGTLPSEDTVAGTTGTTGATDTTEVTDATDGG